LHNSYGGIDPSHIILEYPHSNISCGYIDTYIPPQRGHYELAIELKFDREIPSGRNTPRTQKAGRVFADIFRLALFVPHNNVHRYFVYVTDREISTYFRTPLTSLMISLN
jgi:hypothetical protein